MEKPGKDGSTRPRYMKIRDTLRASLTQGRISPGLVLLEEPIAQVFGTSRAPVRRALELLHDEGLICRFDGRGYLAAQQAEQVEPIRTTLSESSLGLSPATTTVDNRPSADRIFAQVEEAVATCIAFGHFRILETELSEHFGVSRTVTREVLGRLKDRGLVEKNPHTNWVAGPLTARAVAEDYEIRILLEPAALKASAPHLDHRTLLNMRERLQRLLADTQAPTSAAIAAIELDLHEHCLQYANNRKAAAIIRQSQLPVMVNRIFFNTLGASPQEPVLMEHKLVLDHLLHNAIDAAAASLEAHLRSAAERTRRRLKVLSVFPEPELPPYLVRIA
ncbi:GntR family transcriptional regulator [Marinobacterium rhizophilum]|uniref:GntR family transcriptional regulator n=1 Tax=Marinobacterium rhizophilum TaxID=420402 RepID=A0ABY5HIS9_9GAMM|nr:GntR family transcriptional regulator [Marinobacterium rhizophilum]UTW11722.1 GntR family transcriptional regulator [Marinobacterium rhizophilum]